MKLVRVELVLHRFEKGGWSQCGGETSIGDILKTKHLLIVDGKERKRFCRKHTLVDAFQSAGGVAWIT
jgi:hypothetical protein